jgi:RNA polymerase sigma-70 factor (ECF subfamily)
MGWLMVAPLSNLALFESHSVPRPPPFASSEWSGVQAPPPFGSRPEADEDAPASTRRPLLTPDCPDDQLAAAASAGNQRAYAIIWKRYSAQVRSKLVRWLGPHDLEDHVQDVFARLFEQLLRLREPNALRGFLMGITLRMTCAELRRRRRSRLRLTATGEVPELRAPGAIVDHGPDREALWRLEAILGRLAPQSRRLFVLRHVEKLDLVDVAAAMQISVATAKRHLARTSAQVTAMVEREPALADYMGGAPPFVGGVEAAG